MVAPANLYRPRLGVQSRRGFVVVGLLRQPERRVARILPKTSLKVLRSRL
jgi:hypothetical protein